MYETTSILPNEMSDYASANYALRLYVIPRDEFMELDVNAFSGNREFSKEVIIAESAVTSLQINTLTIDTIPLLQQGSIATTLRMDIIHVRANGLVESQFAAAQITGWDNPIEMIYLLEIRFLGRTENNIEKEGTKITFPIVISQVTTNIDHSNTVYNVTASLLPAVMNDYSYSKIPQNMNVGGGNNIVSFFRNFAKKLNTIEEAKVDNKDFSIPPLVHNFEIDERFSDAQVGDPSAQDASKSNKSLYEYDSNENSVSITNGSTIQSFIDNIMQNSPQVQSLVTDEEDFKITHAINPVVTLNGFDKLSGKNTYSIDWKIIAIERRFYSNNTVTEDTISSKFFESINNLKLYDYMYTGMNSEVKSINFDINNLYAAKLAQYGETHLQINNRQGKMGTSNVEQIDKNLQSDILDTAMIPYGKNMKYSNNIQNQTGKIYVDDLTFDEFKYSFYEPKVAYNEGETLNKTSDQTTSQKNKQYDYDLYFIRNSSNVSFLNAELKIKGDPYWILPPGLLPSPESRSTYTENVALVRFSYPTNDMYSENQTINQNSVYTGFYYIQSVSSTFNNGKFEQTLKGFREPRMTPRIVNDFLKEKGVY